MRIEEKTENNVNFLVSLQIQSSLRRGFAWDNNDKWEKEERREKIKKAKAGK